MQVTLEDAKFGGRGRNRQEAAKINWDELLMS